MRHQLLVELRVQHDGYPKGRCTGVQIQPREWQPSGTRALARHRLLTRPQPDGLDVLGRLDERGKPFLDFRGLELSFDMLVLERDFVLRSDLEPLRKLDAPTWRRPRSGNELKLKAGAAPLPAGVLAGIELTDVDAGWLRNPRRFVMVVPAKQALLVFYLVGRRNGATPTILTGEGSRSIGFVCESLPEVEDLASRDPVGAALVARHPGQPIHRLATEQAQAARSQALRGLALRLGEQTLLAELPTPSIHQHTTLALTADSKPRDALYRVLEY
ncbi:hypothetical protein ACNOYE_14630 [Nannocystaceae bacterium ST9]